MKKVIIGSSAGAIPTLALLFAFIIGLGQLEFSGDVVCAGTIEDPCVGYWNFTPSESVSLSKTDDITLEPTPKQLTVYRWKWQKWREVEFPDVKTWRRGTTYRYKIEVLKHNPSDEIKWGVDAAGFDPLFLGVGEAERNPINTPEYKIEDDVEYVMERQAIHYECNYQITQRVCSDAPRNQSCSNQRVTVERNCVNYTLIPSKRISMSKVNWSGEVFGSADSPCFQINSSCWQCKKKGYGAMNRPCQEQGGEY